MIKSEHSQANSTTWWSEVAFPTFSLCSSGHKIVFIKDMCYRLKTFFEADTVETILPRGYMHTFLIRHPAKTIVSWYNGTSKGDSGANAWRGVGRGGRVVSPYWSWVWMRVGVLE